MKLKGKIGKDKIKITDENIKEIKIIDSYKSPPVKIELNDVQFGTIICYLCIIIVLLSTDTIMKWLFTILAALWVLPSGIKILSWFKKK